MKWSLLPHPKNLNLSQVTLKLLILKLFDKKFGSLNIIIKNIIRNVFNWTEKPKPKRTHF